MSSFPLLNHDTMLNEYFYLHICVRGAIGIVSQALFI
jgi:hypothetical protein